jgi:hypothetical protein
MAGMFFTVRGNGSDLSSWFDREHGTLASIPESPGSTSVESPGSDSW